MIRLVNRNKRPFYVVQFIELPFEGIDDYVCVPNTWLIVRRAMDNKAVVAYPKDEDPFDTRDRAKRKERYNDEWRFYMAVIKYESDTYKDAEFWIATRNDYGPLVDDDSKTKDMEPKFKLDNNLRMRSTNRNRSSKSKKDKPIPSENPRKPLLKISNKRPALTEPKEQHDEKRLKLDEAESRESRIDDASNIGQSTVPVVPRDVHQGVANVASATQNLSSLPHQRPSFVRQLDEQLNLPVQEKNMKQTTHVPDLTQRPIKSESRTSLEKLMINEAFAVQRQPNPAANQSSEDLPSFHQSSYLPVYQDNFEQEHRQEQEHWTSTERNNFDHRPNSRTIRIRIPSMRRNAMNVSNQMYRTNELLQHRQLQPNHQEPQRQPCKPKIRINIYIKPKNNKPMPSIQGVTKRMPTRNNYLLNEQQYQASLSGRSTEKDNTGLATASRNITAAKTPDMRSSKMPTCSFYQSPGIQPNSAHENEYQNARTQKQLVDQFTVTNLMMKRVHSKDDVVRSPAAKYSSGVMDSVCQTDECSVEEHSSPYHRVASDSVAVTDHEVIADHEMSIHETPVETLNDVDCSGMSTDSNSDKPTGAQNSTSTKHQTHPRVVLEQQMLDNFATLFTQMGSTLRYTCDMYNNLRSSILETAQTYRHLLDAVERFNTLGNLASNASSNISTPEVPQRGEVTEEIQTVQSNKAPHKRRFDLPPEYDPHDSRWTLKYRKNMPGLVELVPQSGIYVGYGELKYSQQVSKDCKSLVRLLLPEVFKREALSVCLSVTEKAQTSDKVGTNVRPELDEHACMVLINFVIEHGLQCGWDTDVQPILSGIHSVVRKNRLKYG